MARIKHLFELKLWAGFMQPSAIDKTGRGFQHAAFLTRLLIDQNIKRKDQMNANFYVIL